MDVVFNKWCEKLLDTGKGNKLINFKESKLRTLNVLLPDAQTLFHKIENGEKLFFYEIDEYIRKLSGNTFLNDESENPLQYERLSKQEVVNLCGGKLKKNQILSYKNGCTLRKVLTNLKKIAASSLSEKGINILYVAFGFLEWTVKEDYYFRYSSPLVLIPITLSNESKNQPFELTEYEDEITTNPTLVYKLKNEFGIVLPEFREENEEETLAEYLERVGNFADKQGWSVKGDAAIGTFSFLKLNMYKDLKENEDKILANPTVKRLLNREVVNDKNIEEIDIDEYFRQGKEITLHNVVDADSSQTAAIVKAKTGKDLVLQGPPGTGKSQTITNLIAEFLYDGKKILFVSEKLAALNVVFGNLKKAGLSDFCLELHSNKTNKKDVIAELYRVLNGNKKSIKDRASLELDELKTVKEQLDKYANAMHKVQSRIEKTPYEILCEISKRRNAPTFEYAIENVEKKNNEYLKNALLNLDYFIRYSAVVGYDYRQNAWYGYCGNDSTYQAKTELKQRLCQTLDFAEKYLRELRKFSQTLKVELYNRNAIEKYMPFLKCVSMLTNFDACFFKKATLRELTEKVKVFNKNTSDYDSSRKKVGKVFIEDVFNLDFKTLYSRFVKDYSSPFRMFRAEYRHDVKNLKGYLKDKKHKPNYKGFSELLKEGRNAQISLRNVEKINKEILTLLCGDGNGINFKVLEYELKGLNETIPEDILGFDGMSLNEFQELQSEIKRFIGVYEDSLKQTLVIDELQKSFDKAVIDFNQIDYDELIDKLKNILNDFDGLDYQIRFCGVLRNISDLGLKGFVDKSIDENIKRETLNQTFELMFYTQLAYYVFDKNQVLHDFSRLTQDAAVENFKEKDKLKFEISKAEIIAELTKDMPSTSNIASGSQISTLVREANKKSRQRPVRALLRDVGELIQKLKPCFLMSPLSVSTYLDSDTCKFDVVIFDEASQIFPWDAIGAISRGAQTIVVGDSKQMPPSNFFNAGLNEEETNDDDYDDDSLDFESILDLCATAFEQNGLKWHYRSRTEDLIAFSNANFYDNTLITFPSARNEQNDSGVDFHYVSNGVFDRKSKCNLIEAEKVVDLVFEHFDKHPERSLGVVAFSISQQDAIEELIQKRREKDDRYVELFDGKMKEPFFVKNLETVQGDERDTIIFSVAYAKDSVGKFIHNFGPLNRKGGERRLNVAITRAKYNVKLVSSIKSYDLDMSKTDAVGVKLLKEYLYCAEHGMINVNRELTVDETAETESAFELEVYDVLKEAGYRVDRQVGCSGYRIDFGIKHPEKEDYVLAVECDGASYHSGKTTRDRDRLRQEVLEKLGWKFYRVWSTDWFLNKETEKRNLTRAVEESIKLFDEAEENCINDSACSGENKTENFILEEASDKDLKSRFKQYENYDIFSVDLPSFYNTVPNLVAKEAPITEELLLKKTVGFFGRVKVTDAVRRDFSHAIRQFKSICKIKDYYVTDVNMEIEMRIPKDGETPRDITMISTDELASGMFVVIKNSVGITKEGLFATMTNLLGFARKGNNITTKLGDTLNQLINSGKIKTVGEEIFIK